MFKWGRSSFRTFQWGLQVNNENSHFGQLPAAESSFLNMFKALHGLALHNLSSSIAPPPHASHALCQPYGTAMHPSRLRPLHPCLAHASPASSLPPSKWLTITWLEFSLLYFITPLFHSVFHKVELFSIRVYAWISQMNGVLYLDQAKELQPGGHGNAAQGHHEIQE